MNMIHLYQTQTAAVLYFKTFSSHRQKEQVFLLGPCELDSLGFSALFLHLIMYLHDNLIKTI